MSQFAKSSIILVPCQAGSARGTTYMHANKKATSLETVTEHSGNYISIPIVREYASWGVGIITCMLTHAMGRSLSRLSPPALCQHSRWD